MKARGIADYFLASFHIRIQRQGMDRSGGTIIEVNHLKNPFSFAKPKHFQSGNSLLNQSPINFWREKFLFIIYVVFPAFKGASFVLRVYQWSVRNPTVHLGAVSQL